MNEIASDAKIVARAGLASSIVEGLPIWVALELHNKSSQRSVPLQPLELWSPPGGWSIAVTCDQRTVAEVSALPVDDGMHGASLGFTLPARSSRRFLIDLSEVFDEFAAGAYLATARHESAGVEVEFPIIVEAVEPDDLRLLWRVRGGSSWMESVVFGQPDLELLDDLPKRCAEALGLHLWLRKAVRMPSTAEVSRDGLEHLREPLEGEALALKYEIALARGDLAAINLREQLVTRWPGLTWRAEDAEAELGVLLLLQDLYLLETG